MSNGTHVCLNGGLRRFLPPITSFPFAATLRWALLWPENNQILGPKVLPGVYFWLAQAYVFVHLFVVVAVKAFGPERAKGTLGQAPRAAQHAVLVEDAHHVPARLLVHDNILATFIRLLVYQDFMHLGIGSSNVLNVVDSSAA